MRELFQSRRERRSTFAVPQRHSSYSEQVHPRFIHDHHSLPPPPIPGQGRSRSRQRRTDYHEQLSLQQHRPPTTRRGVGSGSRAASRSSRRSRSQPSTANMTDFRSIASATVPSIVNGAVSVSRFSDDETSWISGVESHNRSAGGASTTSSVSKRSRRNPYLRDGKAIKRVIDGKKFQNELLPAFQTT